jgi:hypothetical protein
VEANQPASSWIFTRRSSLDERSTEDRPRID